MRILSLLGLAKNAGGVVQGHDAVLRSVRAGKARLVLITVDASKRTSDRIRAACDERGVAVATWGAMSDVGRALGSRDVAVLAVTHPQFARAMIKSLIGVQAEKGRDVYDKTSSLRVGKRSRDRQ